MTDKIFKVKFLAAEMGTAELTVDLPVTEEELRDITERASIDGLPDLGCEVVEVYQGPVTKEMIRPGEAFKDVDFLAEKILSLSESQRLALEGLLQIENVLHKAPSPLGMTIFLACHAAECKVFPDIHTPLELGKFLYENGMLPPKAQARLDAATEGTKTYTNMLQKQGERRQEKMEGQFVSGGYMEPDLTLMAHMVHWAIRLNAQEEAALMMDSL